MKSSARLHQQSTRLQKLEDDDITLVQKKKSRAADKLPPQMRSTLIVQLIQHALVQKAVQAVGQAPDTRPSPVSTRILGVWIAILDLPERLTLD